MKQLKSNSKKIFLLISSFVLLTDSLFVAINYKSSQEELKKELLRQQFEYTSSFDQYIENAYLSMQKLSNYIANDKTVIRLFETGRKAALAGDKQTAQKYREYLYNYLESSWNALQGKYFVRQLHFHIGPGDTSFLRVHKPEKYGDDLSSIRHTIVDSIKYNKEVTGFESGRVYSGLRGVTPITDKDNNVIGALEAGASFKEIVNNLSKNIHSDFAVLLNVDYMRETMWEERLKPFFDKNPPIKNSYIEATSSPFINNILKLPNINLNSQTPQVIERNEEYYSLFTTTLHSYQTKRDQNKNGVGQILIWHDITPIIQSNKKQFLVNLLYGILAFLLIELAIYKGIRIATQKLEKIITLQKTDLYQKNQRLEKFNQMLSHDLKNSLNSVIGMSDISLHYIEDIDNANIKHNMNEYLQTIHNAGQHMDKLVTNLLIYSQEGVQNKDLYDLKSLTQEVCSILKSEIEETGTKVNLNENEAYIFVNKHLFTQALFNLINNSIKYRSNHHKPEISISCTENKTQSKIVISDNGIGIENKNLDKVFNLSYRETKANQKATGHGIGLHTVKDIIEAHNGTIKAVPNKSGASFIITLPKQPEE